jgi:DNA-binding response OmpR family regulator
LKLSLKRGRARESGRLRPGAGGETAIRFPGAPVILHLDDESSLRLLVRVNLEEHGINVIEAADGVRGIEMARTARPDLILLDVTHPGPDGYEVAQALKADERTQDIPVVFLTYRAEARDRARGLELGAVDYITKPFNPLELAPRIWQLLSSAGSVGEALRKQVLRDLDAADIGCRRAEPKVELLN